MKMIVIPVERAIMFNDFNFITCKNFHDVEFVEY